MDFTIKAYNELLETLSVSGYTFITFEQYCKEPLPNNYIILRHDVESDYKRALSFSKLQKRLDVKGAYYFRFTKAYDANIVKQIAELGHEIGYHYDDLTACDCNYEKAIHSFQNNLKTLRGIAPVSTICMEGAPRSKYDNRDLWNKYNYQDYGIIGEPYFDVNFDEVFYLTDTGRRWDGWKVSVRDKVLQQENWNKEGLVFHSTNDIIRAIEGGTLPDKIMMTFHPQRWHNKPLPWLKELIVQNAKNIVKRVMIKLR